jgi:hypothetical protein
VVVGWSPLSGLRWAGIQVLTTRRIHIAVCDGCGFNEALLSDDLTGTLAEGQHTWTTVPGLDELYCDTATGRTQNHPCG